MAWPRPLACGAGLTSTQLHNAFGIDQSIDLTTFNALGDAMQSPGGVGLSILKVLISHTRLAFSAPRVQDWVNPLHNKMCCSILRAVLRLSACKDVLQRFQGLSNKSHAVGKCKHLQRPVSCTVHVVLLKYRTAG